MQTPPPLPTNRPPGWWDRNWQWFVPILCVAGMVVIAGFIFSVFGIMKSSDAYAQAVARTKSAPAVVDAIGSPVKEGLFLSGNINVSGSSGRADLAIPVSGPKGSATILVVARKGAGVWHFDRLIVQVRDSGARIDLSDQ